MQMDPKDGNMEQRDISNTMNKSNIHVIKIPEEEQMGRINI